MSLWSRRKANRSAADALSVASSATPADRDESSPGWRSSHGVEFFFQHLRDARNLNILDLGMLSQETTEQLGELGHHLHFASLVAGYDEARPTLASQDGEVSRRAADRFVRQYLDFAPRSFHAVLAWDVLQQLDRSAMQSTIAHLGRIVLPNAVMFCIFQEPDEDGTISILDGAVSSHTTLKLREVGRRRPRQVFTPRELEFEFPQFRSVHFFLKRDSLLEVLVLS